MVSMSGGSQDAKVASQVSGCAAGAVCSQVGSRLRCLGRLPRGWLCCAARGVIFTIRWINEGPD